MRLHLCGRLSLSKVCRQLGTDRLHIDTDQYQVIIALRSESRSQLYDWDTGRYSKRFGWISVRPGPEHPRTVARLS